MPSLRYSKGGYFLWYCEYIFLIFWFLSTYSSSASCSFVHSSTPNSQLPTPLLSTLMSAIALLRFLGLPPGIILILEKAIGFTNIKSVTNQIKQKLFIYFLVVTFYSQLSTPYSFRFQFLPNNSVVRC